MANFWHSDAARNQAQIVWLQAIHFLNHPMQKAPLEIPTGLFKCLFLLYFGTSVFRLQSSNFITSLLQK